MVELGDILELLEVVEQVQGGRYIIYFDLALCILRLLEVVQPLITWVLLDRADEVQELRMRRVDIVEDEDERAEMVDAVYSLWICGISLA